jgi:hypothetical protein
MPALVITRETWNNEQLGSIRLCRKCQSRLSTKPFRLSTKPLKETGQATPPNTPKPPDGGCSMGDPMCRTWYQWYLQHRRNPYFGYGTDAAGVGATLFKVPYVGPASAFLNFANDPSAHSAITNVLGLLPGEGATWPTTLFVDGFDYGINNSDPTAGSRLGFGGQPFVDDGASAGSSNSGGLPSGPQGGGVPSMTQEGCKMTGDC